MVITVALYIILGIIAFFVFIFTVRARVTVDMDGEELKLSLRVLGITIKILPKKPKKYKISNYTLKKIAKRDAKKAAKEAKKQEAAKLKRKKKEEERKKKKETEATLTKEQKKERKARKRASSPPLPKLVQLLLSVLGFFFPGLFTKFHFHVSRIKLRIGGKDAAEIALTYYAVSRAMRPVLGFIEKYSNLHGRKRAEIEIVPDFLSEEIKADVKLGFSTSIGGILGILLKTGFKFLFGFLKIKPSAAEIGEKMKKYSKNKPAANTESGTQNDEKKPVDIETA